MKQFWLSLIGAFVGLLLVLIIIGGAVVMKMNEKTKIEDRSWLVVDLYGEVLEYPPPAGPLGMLTGGEPETLHRILDNFEKAQHDERIEGVIMKVAGNSAGTASVQEIRGAMKKLQLAGKRVIGWSDSIDRSGYYLAAACDELYMPPSAYIQITGLGRSSTHVKGALEKLGVKPQLHKIKDYKSAAELIIREDLSPAAKENMEWIFDDGWDTFVTDLEEDRKLDEAKILAIMEKAILGPTEASQLGMIDGVVYWDELEDMLKGSDDDELRTVSQCRYAEVSREDLDLKGDKKIAVVHAQGNIGGRKSGIDPLLGIMMGHESVIADLRAASEDEDVAAIVFRVDSGGGESLASDLISHEVGRIAKTKPVICSMVDVAASGGYSIAYQASKIIADPISITGSIGSISAKFNTTEFWEKLGITHDHVSRGPNAFFWSQFHDFNDEQWKLFTEDHWRGVNEWMTAIAEHRGMSFKDLEKLAHGRVFTGRQAVENGLIDDLGGLDRAIEIAKEIAEIPEDEQVTLIHYPEPQDMLTSILSGGEMSAVVDWALYRYIREDLAQSWRLFSSGQVATDFSID